MDVVMGQNEKYAGGGRMRDWGTAKNFRKHLLFLSSFSSTWSWWCWCWWWSRSITASILECICCSSSNFPQLDDDYGDDDEVDDNHSCWWSSSFMMVITMMMLMITAKHSRKHLLFLSSFPASLTVLCLRLPQKRQVMVIQDLCIYIFEFVYFFIFHK